MPTPCYRCDTCSTAYDTATEAAGCEAAHPIIDGLRIVKAEYAPKPQERSLCTPPANWPNIVVIENGIGEKAEYSFRKRVGKSALEILAEQQGVAPYSPEQ